MDPVPILQQEINYNMSKLKKNLSNREDMLNDKRGGNIDIFNNIGVQMLDDIKVIRTSLSDIAESIEAVRKHMGDYNITETTLLQREQYIKVNLDELIRIEQEVQTQNNRRNTLNKTVSYSGPQTFSNTDGQQSLTDLIKKDQIEDLHYSATLSKQLANQIFDELNDQQNLISTLDDDVTNADEAMKKVTSEIKKLMEIEGKTPTMLVAILSVVFIILLFIVI